MYVYVLMYVCIDVCMYICMYVHRVCLNILFLDINYRALWVKHSSEWGLPIFSEAQCGTLWGSV